MWSYAVKLPVSVERPISLYRLISMHSGTVAFVELRRVRLDDPGTSRSWSYVDRRVPARGTCRK